MRGTLLLARQPIHDLAGAANTATAGARSNARRHRNLVPAHDARDLRGRRTARVSQRDPVPPDRDALRGGVASPRALLVLFGRGRAIMVLHLAIVIKEGDIIDRGFNA